MTEKLVNYLMPYRNSIETLKANGRTRLWIPVRYIDGWKPRNLYLSMEKFFTVKGYDTYFYRDHSVLVICF